MNKTIEAELSAIEMATRRLLVTCAMLTDHQTREPSLLPGWTRGHVLTHIARNADGLVNLLTWASTGTPTPMYPSQETRDADIEAGSARPAADLLVDVRDSAARFAAAAGRVPEQAWSAEVGRTPSGPYFPARRALSMRLSEVTIHHADLGAGYGPGDWPADFVAEALPRVGADFTDRQDVPGCMLKATDGAFSSRIGPAGSDTDVIVTGPGHALLAWLLGRGSQDLAVAGAPAVPGLPRWR